MKKIIYTILTLVSLASLCGITSCSKDGYSEMSPSTGTGGSLARFTIAGNYLYAVDQNALKTYRMNTDGSLNHVSTIVLGADIETIYPYKDKLFIGSREAMYIYKLNNPELPEFEQMASHVRACDPVVAKDNYAYVTVRSGNTCGGTVNALYIYQVDNLNYPQLLNTYSLQGPYGLGIKDNTLYVCDGAGGLRIFDVSNPSGATLTGTRAGYTFYDCIPYDYDNVLICMVDGGMVIYDISNPQDPVFQSQTF
jgi:hypothetical protein